nr:putative coatomer subunit beta'-3 [Lolium perenne]
MGGCVDGLLCVDYFKRRDRWHLITGRKYRTAQIWDLEMELAEGSDKKKGCVETLEGHAGNITAVNWHPELSLLVTGSLDGTIRLWDSQTYKLENITSFNLGAVHAFGFLTGTRMVVGCDQGIAFLEISLPSRSCTEEETKRNIS